MRSMSRIAVLMFLFSVQIGADMATVGIEPIEQRIELTIRKSTYMTTKAIPIRADMPIIVVVHNEDPIRHGFTSPLLSGLSVKGQGEGIAFHGRGIEGVHIGPGKTLELSIIVPYPGGGFSFHCDLHPSMEGGEVYLLQVPVG